MKQLKAAPFNQMNFFSFQPAEKLAEAGAKKRNKFNKIKLFNSN